MSGEPIRGMGAEERREAWEALSLVEDWLEGGILRRRTEPDFAEAAAADAAPEGAPAGEPRLEGPGESLDAIGAEVARCAACRLASGRSRAVCGEGPAEPLVLVVGEGPGAEEDASGRPFVGPAGRLLDRMLASVGLSRRTNCYIANVVKCRPPGNRDPAPDEEEACLGYLRRQAAALRPRYVLCLGRVAAQALTGSRDGINKLRGKWLEYEGIPLLATFHPSALLRDESYKRPAWEDLKLLKARMESDGIFPEPTGAGPGPDAGLGDG